MTARFFLRRSAYPAALAILAAGTVSVPLVAQQSRLERDLTFVRDLATKLRFISLAQSEVDRLKLRYKDGEDFQSVAQLGIEISLIGAQLEGNRAERRTLYKEALDKVRDFLSRYSDGQAADAARMTLANASLEFGRFLAEELELARADEPAKVPELEEDAAAVFRAGEDACDAVKQALESRKDDNPRLWTDYHLAWMRKGILLREHARAVAKDRSYLAERSRSELEELIFEVGEETALGQRALFEYAQNDEVVGELDDAVANYQGVIQSADTVLTDESLQLSSDVRELMVVTMEEAYERAALVLLQQGKRAEVMTLVDDYRNRLGGYGVPLTNLEQPVEDEGKEDERFGHGMYLAYAQALADGGSDEELNRALTIVQAINDWHGNDFVGLRAKSALKDILEAQSQRVSGGLLLEVAKGDYIAKNYERAITGIHHALSMMTDAELAEHGMEAHFVIGHSMALQGRVLEATMALKEGLERFGDGEDKNHVSRAADMIQKTLNQVRSNAKNDAFFNSLGDDVNGLVVRFGSAEDATKRIWNEALREFGKRNYEGALRQLRSIPKGELYYEWAQARIAMCHHRMGDFDAARKAIADYRAYRQTKDANLPDDDNAAEQVRRIAEGEIAFAEGAMLYEEGTGGDNREADATKIPEAIRALGEFEASHGEAVPAMVPRAIYYQGRCYIALGNLDKAEEKQRQLIELAPRDTTVPILASAIFGAYHDKVGAQETEVAAIETRGEDAEAAREALDTLRRKTVAIGQAYLRDSGDPQYTIAYHTIKHAQDLRDWPLVEKLGNDTLERFGEDAELATNLDRQIRPVIGDAVLRQHKYREAHEMLTAAEAARPNDYPLKRLVALALGGWQEVDERTGRIVSFLGLEKPVEAYEKYWGEYKTYALDSTKAFEDHSLDWYRFHFELLHFAREAAKKDSKYQQYAVTLFNKARSFDEFAQLEKFGLEGRNLRDMFLENDPR